MADRIRTVTVVLDRDYRDDDVEPILAALRMVKGVEAVTGIVATPGDQMTLELAKVELRSEIAAAITKILSPSFEGDYRDRLRR